jgi:hypothetical protein
MTGVMTAGVVLRMCGRLVWWGGDGWQLGCPGGRGGRSGGEVAGLLISVERSGRLASLSDASRFSAICYVFLSNKESMRLSIETFR